MTRTTVLDLRRRKAERAPQGTDGTRPRAAEPIVMITAYDATMARLVDASGADMVLVGDSLGMVVQGHTDTLPVTLDQMVYHTRCVSRAVQRAHVVADMPFMSYQVSPEQALLSAGRLVQEGFAQSVKLEGGARSAPAIAKIVEAGIPVVGHVGLTPQSVHAMGGFRVQGRTQDAAERVVEDAIAVAEAGAFCVVLEGMPSEVAAEITARLDIPTIGIGAGVSCDGQVLVCNDILGLNLGFKPKFVKRYAELETTVVDAFRRYGDEVRSGAFPDAAHAFAMDSGALRLDPAAGKLARLY